MTDDEFSEFEALCRERRSLTDTRAFISQDSNPILMLGLSTDDALAAVFNFDKGRNQSLSQTVSDRIRQVVDDRIYELDEVLKPSARSQQTVT